MVNELLHVSFSYTWIVVYSSVVGSPSSAGALSSATGSVTTSLGVGGGVAGFSHSCRVPGVGSNRVPSWSPIVIRV